MQKLTIAQEQECIKGAISYFHNFCVENHINYFMISGTMLGAVREKGFISWDDDADFGMLRSDYQLFLSKIDLFENDKYSIEHYTNVKKVCHSIIRIRINGVFFNNFGNYKKQYFSNLFFDILPFDYLPKNGLTIVQEKKLDKLKKKLYLKTTKNPAKTVLGFLKNVARLFVFSSSNAIAEKTDCLCRRMERSGDMVCSMMSKYSYNKETFPADFFKNLALYPFSDLMLYGPRDYDAYLAHIYGMDYMTPKKDPDIIPNEAFVK